MRYLLLCLLLPIFAQAQTDSTVTPADLARLPGYYTGELAYMDYSSGKLTAIKAAMDIKSRSELGDAWELQYIYPTEPKANEKDKIKLSKDGTEFFGRTVIRKTYEADSTLVLVTEEEGKDNRQRATFRYTIRLSATSLILQKEVCYLGSREYFVRNRYTLARQ